MKNKIILFLIATFQFSCQSQDKDIQIPDKVAVNRDKQHKQFPATRVFIVPPLGYDLVPKLVRFQKGENYIQVLELPHSSFTN
jgi:hypothetical protein